jgi:hypothetical protein
MKQIAKGNAELRVSFERHYAAAHPDDKCTKMPNGRYSGWFKQVMWQEWQQLHFLKGEKKS